jgi:hypothetical protein
MPDPAIEAAYRATDYRVDDSPAGSFVLRIGEPSAAAGRLLAIHRQTEWAFVTAWNPGSVRLSDEENTRRMADLEQLVRLHGWRYYHGHGVGRDGQWPPEPSLLIIGISAADAVGLGAEYGQNAVVVGGADGIGRLAWVV